MQRLLPFLATCLILAACSAPVSNKRESAPSAPQPTSSPQVLPDPTEALSKLMNTLRAAGGTVELTTDTVAPIVAPRPGRVLLVNDQRLAVFEYGTVAQADKAALAIPADGVLESAPAHFYREGTLLARYAGNDSALRDVLAHALGQPFAGTHRPNGQCGAWHTSGVVSVSLAPALCIVWSDPFEDETGFRVTLTYPNTQETFTHAVGPDAIELLLPEAEATAPGDCQRWSSYRVEVVALRSDGETPLGLLATDSGCDTP